MSDISWGVCRDYGSVEMCPSKESAQLHADATDSDLVRIDFAPVELASEWGVMWSPDHRIEMCVTKAQAVARADEFEQQLVEIVFHA